MRRILPCIRRRWKKPWDFPLQCYESSKSRNDRTGYSLVAWVVSMNIARQESGILYLNPRKNDGRFWALRSTLVCGPAVR